MATVMEFTSPAAEFPLGGIFENLPEVTVELERLIPHGAVIVPYFWVRGAAIDDIEEVFGSPEGVTDIRFVDNVEEEYLMRADWKQGYVGILSALSETSLTVLSGVGKSDGWRFEVRGETREEISEFRSYCTDNDIAINITAVHALLPVSGAGYELTDPQREALIAAYEGGYFDSPRTASLADIAAELGITQQSLSARLKRGHRQLIEATLIGDPEP